MSKTTFLQPAGAEIAREITQREYNRLLQLPRDRVLEGDLLERAESARAWYAEFGKPFAAACNVPLASSLEEQFRNSRGAGVSPAGRGTVLSSLAGETPAPQRQATNIVVVRAFDRDVVLESLVLAQRLQAGEAHALVVLAASAGREVADEVARHWSEGRPDEGFFLDRFAVAVTERLVFWASGVLCRNAEASQETLLPHLSPGCGNWDLADQHKLMSMLVDHQEEMTLGPLRLLESGALEPQHSVLVAMGVTRHRFVSSPEHLCRACDLSPCSFRRAPFSGDRISAGVELR